MSPKSRCRFPASGFLKWEGSSEGQFSPLSTNGPKIMTNNKTKTACPHCGILFLPRRSDQQYCARSCSKAATRNTSRGSRRIENVQRTRLHYDRAAWLSYDLNRMPQQTQRRMLLELLEAAAGHDAPLRNILLDPALLGAARGDSTGKLYPDSRSADARNIAKLVNDFCRNEWGVGVREALMDNGKPAGRLFRERNVNNVPPHIYGRN